MDHSLDLKDFYFFSDFLNRGVYNPLGQKIGKLSDLVAERAEPYPMIIGIVVRTRGRQKRIYLPWEKTVRIEPQITLSEDELRDYQSSLPEKDIVLLREEVMDRQIVDTFGAKVVRVNDLHFLRVNSNLRLVHVDVGFRGLMRRVGWEKMVDQALRWLFSYDLPNQFISWKYVQLLSGSDLLQLNVSQKKLSHLHPADLADIIEDLSGRERSAIFHALDTETAADALEEIDPKIQKSLIEEIPVEKASDIVEEMSPSDAVDLLADLPEERAEEILEGMEQEKAEDLRELLVHPEKTAGGLMTTAYLSLTPGVTVEGAVAELKTKASNLDIIDYIYVVDEEEVLQGVVSIRDLLTAQSHQSLSGIQAPRVVSVKPDADENEVVEAFAKYGFRALPVVDEGNRLRGVIGFRSVLEVLAPDAG
ncbi:MAG: CBS domain-containing protein [Thermodesulfobacteriota bacterium]|jgi:CBS domain-containing protein/sporulation protein YlmC with PRC-barrel domain